MLITKGMRVQMESLGTFILNAAYWNVESLELNLPIFANYNSKPLATKTMFFAAPLKLPHLISALF